MKIGLMILLMFTGFVILALPDSDERLFSISKDLGPSLQDVVVLIILLKGYGGLVIMSWKSREKVFRHKHSFFRSGLLLFGAATTLVLGCPASQ